MKRDGREAGWRLSIWGRAALTRDGEPVRLRPRERSVLAALAVDHPRSAPAERLIDLIWGDRVPASANQSLYNHIARLRDSAGPIVETTDSGYRLSDAVELVGGGSSRVAEIPFADLANGPDVDAARSDAGRRRVTERFDRLLQLDAAGELAVSEVEIFAHDHPEHLDGSILLARSLAANGRRREALDAVRVAHRANADLGLRSSRSLRDLERRLLDDDPTLIAPSGSATGEPEPEPRRGDHLIVVDEHLTRLEMPPGPGTTRLMLVTGPAGSGKTTLVEHVRDRATAAGVMTVLASCSPEPSVPMEPIADILHQLIARFPDEVVAAADLRALRTLVPSLPPAPAGGLVPPQSDRSAVLAAVVDALTAAPIPLIAIVEDLHWATPLTSKILQACVVSTDVNDSLSIIGTSRHAPPELVDRAAEHIELAPWTSDMIREYVSRFGRTGAWLDEAAAWIDRHSGGNALYVRELTTLAHGTAAGPGGEFVRPLDAPPGLLASLRETVAGLSPIAQRDVGAAAVLGRRFRRSEWAELAAAPDRSLEEALSAGVLLDDVSRSTGQHDLEFRHDLLHQLVLDDLSAGQRAEWHDLAADTIENASCEEPARSDRADEVAHHAIGAATLDPQRAVRALVRSIDVDLDRFADETAIEKCRTGLAFLGDQAPLELRPGVVDFEVRLGKALLHLGDPDALGQLLAAAEHALDSDAEDELVATAIREACRLGPTSLAGTVHETARALLDRAMNAVSDPRAVAGVATAGVMLYLVSGEHERCRAFFELADEYREPDDVRVGALALAVLALTEADDLDRRVAIERELTHLTPRIGTADAAWAAVHLRMANQVQTGDPAMRKTLVELGELAVAMRQRVRHWEATNWSASVAVTDGDPERAELLAAEGLACLDAVSESLVMSTYGAHLLTIRHAQGRLADLVELVQPIVDGDTPIGAWRAVLACAAADAGDHELAREQLDIVCANDFEVLDRDLTFNAALFVAALAASEINAVDLGAVIEPELGRWSGQWSLIATCTLGPVDTGLAHLALLRGDTVAALSSARRALESAQRAVAPIYEAQARSLIAVVADTERQD